jgi:hypothetical protein
LEKKEQTFYNLSLIEEILKGGVVDKSNPSFCQDNVLGLYKQGMRSLTVIQRNTN